MADSSTCQPSNAVYLSNFPKKLEKKVLESLLLQYGPLLSLNIIHKNEFAFAFAEFDDIRDAVYAVKELNQRLFHGMNLKVQFRNRKIRDKQTDNQCKGKKQQLKQQQSPRSTLQTACNIASSRPRERSNSSHSRSPRQNDRLTRRQRVSVESDLSFSRSPSRSRTKRIRTERCRDNLRQSYRSQYSRDGQNSVQKYRQRRQEYRPSTNENEITRMYEMIRYFGKSLQKLEDKLEDLFYDKNHQARPQIRKRN